MKQKIASLKAAAAFYGKRDMIVMALFGFSCGLPLLLTSSTLAIRMTEGGIDIRTIGLFSLVGIPYVCKFLWSPFLDILMLPILGERMGRRRSMLLLSQVALIASVVFMGTVEPRHIEVTALAAFLTSFLSATQDCLIDAYRIEHVPAQDQAPALAIYSILYRKAMVISLTGTILLMASMKGHFFLTVHKAWFWGYTIMAALLLLGVVGTLLAREKRHGEREKKLFAELFAIRFKEAVISPFQLLTEKPGWLYLIFFIVLYKVGDIFSGHMLVPFLIHKGYQPKSYAEMLTIGIVTGFAGSIAAGFLIRLIGLSRAVLCAGLMQNVSNIAFTALDFLPVHDLFLATALGLEHFFGQMGSLVFLTWLSRLCGHSEFTATEYSMLTCLSAVARVVLPASSGYFAYWMGYSTFFIFTVFLGLPSLLCFVKVRHHYR